MRDVNWTVALPGKALPMLTRLADGEREARDDLADWP
jgi:hypothetical protein